MKSSVSSHKRRWQYLTLLVMLVTSLAGGWSVAGAEHAPVSPSQLHNSTSTYMVDRLGSSSAVEALATSPQSGFSASNMLAPQDAPVPAPPAVSIGKFRYFPETAHFIRGIFLAYWQTHGATGILGLPITEALTENGMAVQYLERARLEWHPEISSDPTKQVLLTRLGAVSTEARGLSFPSQTDGSNTDNSHFFTETGHNLSNAFLTFWLRNGGLAVFGYPLSEEIVETNEADGRQYTVQYFERNRFEWHPERSASNNVQLGLLGTEYARMENINPLSRVLLPGEFTGSDQNMSDSPQLAKLVDPGILPAVKLLGNTDQFRWVPALIIKYNIAITFEVVQQQDVAGAFIITSSRTRPYAIIIPDTERTAPVEVLASVIAHESTHGFDTVTGALSSTTDCSIEAETRAFMNGLAAWILLKGDDALSQRYESGSISQAINGSLRRFNGNSTTLSFGFDPQVGRNYLISVYGADCGQ